MYLHTLQYLNRNYNNKKKLYKFGLFNKHIKNLKSRKFKEISTMCFN